MVVEADPTSNDPEFQRRHISKSIEYAVIEIQSRSMSDPPRLWSKLPLAWKHNLIKIHVFEVGNSYQLGNGIFNFER